MASASLTPYYSNAAQFTYALVSTSKEETTWKVANRGLGEPDQITIRRKMGAPGSLTNDHIILEHKTVENNATTGKPATFVITLDISVARDRSVVNNTALARNVAALCSLCFNSTATPASLTAINTLIEGMDL